MRKTDSAKEKFYRKNTSVAHRHSVHRDTFSPMGSLQEKLFPVNFCFLIFSDFQLLRYHSSMHFWWRFILASYLQTLFLRSSGSQAKPLGFYNVMSCLFLLFFREKAYASLVSFSVYLFCCTWSVWGGHYMRQRCVNLFVIHQCQCQFKQSAFSKSIWQIFLWLLFSELFVSGLWLSCPQKYCTPQWTECSSSNDLSFFKGSCYVIWCGLLLFCQIHFISSQFLKLLLKSLPSIDIFFWHWKSASKPLLLSGSQKNSEVEFSLSSCCLNS